MKDSFSFFLGGGVCPKSTPSIDSAPVRALQKADCTSKFRFFEHPCHFELSTKHGINGKTKITCHGNVPHTLLRGCCVWQVRSKSPHLPALSPAESHRRQVRMAGDFQVRLAGGAVGLCGMRSRNRHRTPRKRRRRASSVTAIMMVQPSNPT